MTTHLTRVLYISQIASPDTVSEVANIIRTARSFNPTHDITGVLVFDGGYFCQYIEGPDQPMTELVERIREDVRHVQFNPLLHSQNHAERLFERWSMAYLFVDDPAALSVLAGMQPLQALQYLLDLQPELDMA